jgi:hypothetical protein
MGAYKKQKGSRAGKHKKKVKQRGRKTNEQGKQT